MRQKRRLRRAFTLLEMAISLSVVSILLGAMGSTVVLASRTLPSSSSPADAIQLSGRAWSILADDLRVASTVRIPSDASIELTIPERGENDADITVIYQWSGTSGEPLTRQVDAGNPATLLARVDDLTIAWATDLSIASGSPHRVRAKLSVNGSVVTGEQRCLNAERLP